MWLQITGQKPVASFLRPGHKGCQSLDISPTCSLPPLSVSPLEPPLGLAWECPSSLWSWCPPGPLCSPQPAFTAPKLSPLPPSCDHTLLLPSLCRKFKPRTIHCMPAPSSNRNHQSLTKINEPLLSARDQGVFFFFPKYCIFTEERHSLAAHSLSSPERYH